MKHAITFLCLALLTATASAVEYVMVKVGETKTVAPSSLIEVSVIPGSANGSYGCTWAYTEGGNGNVFWSNNGGADSSSQRLVRRLPLSGVTSITASNATLSLKITTAEELNSITSGIVTLPAETGQGYTVTLEQSTDLINFSPVAP